jgi:hypothetical protein
METVAPPSRRQPSIKFTDLDLQQIQVMMANGARLQTNCAIFGLLLGALSLRRLFEGLTKGLV